MKYQAPNSISSSIVEQSVSISRERPLPFGRKPAQRPVTQATSRRIIVEQRAAGSIRCSRPPSAPDLPGAPSIASRSYPAYRCWRDRGWSAWSRAARAELDPLPPPVACYCPSWARPTLPTDSLDRPSSVRILRRGPSAAGARTRLLHCAWPAGRIRYRPELRRVARPGRQAVAAWKRPDRARSSATGAGPGAAAGGAGSSSAASVYLVFLSRRALDLSRARRHRRRGRPGTRPDALSPRLGAPSIDAIRRARLCGSAWKEIHETTAIAPWPVILLLAFGAGPAAAEESVGAARLRGQSARADRADGGSGAYQSWPTNSASSIRVLMPRHRRCRPRRTRRLLAPSPRTTTTRARPSTVPTGGGQAPLHSDLRPGCRTSRRPTPTPKLSS